MDKFSIVFILAIMALAGCGKTAPAISVKEESSVIAKVPKGCPQQNTILVKSPESGDVAFTTLNSFYIYHSIDWGTLYFTNYSDFDPQNPFAHEYAGKDVTAYFDLKVKDKSAIKPGLWNYRKLGENNELGWINVSTEKLAGGIFDDKAKVEVTYLGKDYVCGKVISNDNKSSLNGEFIAKVYK